MTSKITSIRNQFKQAVNQAKEMFPETLDDNFKNTYFKSSEFYNWMTGETNESPIYEGTGTHVVKTLAFNGKNYQFGDDSAQTFQVNGNFNERIDEVHAGGGDDRLYDHTTDDGVKLFGGAGNDYIQGGDGDNVINGGTGVNRLNGWSGNDSFVFNDEIMSYNVVEDFNIYDYGEDDKIQLSEKGDQKYMVWQNNSVEDGFTIMNGLTGSWMQVKHVEEAGDIVKALGTDAEPLELQKVKGGQVFYEDAAGNEITFV